MSLLPPLFYYHFPNPLPPPPAFGSTFHPHYFVTFTLWTATSQLDSDWIYELTQLGMSLGCLTIFGSGCEHC